MKPPKVLYCACAIPVVMATSRPAPEKDEDFELLSDGPQPAVDGAEAATSSKEPNEPCDIGKTLSVLLI